MNNSDKVILDLCGGTGSWSKPYKDAGYSVITITLPEYDILEAFPCKREGVRYIVFPRSNNRQTWVEARLVYGVLAAPPCTEFSFAKSNSKYPRDIVLGMQIVKACLNIVWQCQYGLPTPLAKRTTLKFWALENPYGLLRRFLGNPLFEFNPYDFGDMYKKRTQLWGFFNLPLKQSFDSEKINKDYIHTINPKGRSLKKFDQLLNNEIAYNSKTKGLSRQERRAITPPGFAQAFFKANQ